MSKIQAVKTLTIILIIIFDIYILGHIVNIVTESF